MSGLYYEDDTSGYAVEECDRVDVRIDGTEYEGFVTRLHPRRREVTVRYEDWLDFARRTGDPKTKTVRVSHLAVDLIRRDG